MSSEGVSLLLLVMVILMSLYEHKSSNEILACSLLLISVMKSPIGSSIQIWKFR